MKVTQRRAGLGFLVITAFVALASAAYACTMGVGVMTTSQGLATAPAPAVAGQFDHGNTGTSTTTGSGATATCLPNCYHASSFCPAGSANPPTTGFSTTPGNSKPKDFHVHLGPATTVAGGCPGTGAVTQYPTGTYNVTVINSWGEDCMTSSDPLIIGRMTVNASGVGDGDYQVPYPYAAAATGPWSVCVSDATYTNQDKFTIAL